MKPCQLTPVLARQLTPVLADWVATDLGRGTSCFPVDSGPGFNRFCRSTQVPVHVVTSLPVDHGPGACGCNTSFPFDHGHGACVAFDLPVDSGPGVC